MFDIITIILILLVIIILLINNNNKNIIDEFSISIHILNETVLNYKQQVFIHRLEKLENSYDLEQDSKTNAQKLFNETYNLFLKDCCIEIINNFLNKKTIKLLNNYFTTDGLILFIIKLLKE